ncbi:5-hydroxytryptamine receptor 3A-like [Spinachia spinachia]
MLLYAILDVNEKEQRFSSLIWVFSRWYEPDINWNPQNFCGIWKIYPPSDVLWTPDLTIEEMLNANKISPSPYLLLDYDGEVFLRSNMVVVSSCKIKVYKFPFDVQNCKLSFKSIVHSTVDLVLQNAADSEWNMEWSLSKMPQSEWLFVNLSISEELLNNFGLEQTVLVYTITMKRRSALYIANFLLPVLFFLCLDLASFLISDSGGEKLGFKVTVLLAVTVMQLILNEILPSSSDRIPLIAVYCIGMFGLMMLSLLETILVMYLMGKDSQDNEADKNQSQSEDCGGKVGKVVLHNYDRGVKNWTSCGCICEVSADEPPSEMLSVDREANSCRPAEESSGLEKILYELKEVEKTLNLLLTSRKQEGKPGYWTRVTKTINKVFFISYVIVACLFLVVIFTMWINAEDE